MKFCQNLEAIVMTHKSITADLEKFFSVLKGDYARAAFFFFFRPLLESETCHFHAKFLEKTFLQKFIIIHYTSHF